MASLSAPTRRAWGSDIHTEVNPYEAGLGWAVRPNKGEFVGRAALLRAREAGIERKLILFGNLPIEQAQKGAQVQVMYFDRRFMAVVDDDPLFDPQMTRVK